MHRLASRCLSAAIASDLTPGARDPTPRNAHVVTRGLGRVGPQREEHCPGRGVRGNQDPVRPYVLPSLRSHMGTACRS